MKRWIAVSMLALVAAVGSGEVAARAGGGVSVGRAAPSISRAPSFSRPSVPHYSAPSVPAPRAPVTNSTTVIHQGGGGGGGFGSSFLGGAAGAMVGNALTRPAGTVAVPAAAPVAAAVAGGEVVTGVPGPTAVVVGSSSSWGWFWFLILACLVVGLLVWLFMRHKEKASMSDDEFDPLHFFYAVQQAAMRDDLPALSRLCTRGMASVLSGNPEPDRSATKTLTGVVHRWQDEDSIEYRFTDAVEGKRVTELWQLSNGRLAGIEVVPQ